jgi:hypothetical protein
MTAPCYFELPDHTTGQCVSFEFYLQIDEYESSDGGCGPASKHHGLAAWTNPKSYANGILPGRIGIEDIFETTNQTSYD